MAINEDARPFVVLRKDAAEFKSKFDEDIKKCIEFLDSKITALICDPDSVGSPFGEAKRQNAHVEFSKAKYEVFKSITSLCDELEEVWLKRISEMKNLFLENVEIFLAGTKLEVKFPSEDTLSSAKQQDIHKISKGKREYSRFSTVESLINTAKSIPVLNNLLASKDVSEEASDDSNEEAVGTSVTPNMRKVRRLTFTPSEVLKQSTGLSTSSRSIRNLSKVEDINTYIQTINYEKDEVNENSSDEEALDVSKPLLRKSGIKPRASVIKRSKSLNVTDVDLNEGIPRGRKSTPNRMTVNQSDVNFSEVPKSGRRRGPKNRDVMDQSEVTVEEVKADRRRNTRKKNIVDKPDVPSTPANVSKVRSRKGTPNRVTVDPLVPEFESEKMSDANSIEASKSPLKMPKKVQFAINDDIDDDLDLYTSEEVLTKSAARRRTIYNKPEEIPDDLNISKEVPTRSTARRRTICNSFEENLEDLNVTFDRVIQTSSKRKTISGLNAAPSPKRLRSGKKSSVASTTSVQEEPANNLLDSDRSAARDNCTSWIPLKDIDGKIPTQPGIYEFKVWRAKKSAFIGSCENLRQKLTLHNVGQNSGHKHLDKFLERNAHDVLVRYEELSSFSAAKVEEKNRIQAFVSLHKTTPAYN